MTQTLIRPIAARLFPGPVIAVAYLVLAPLLAIPAGETPALWTTVLAGLAIAGTVVAALFSQWRSLAATVLTGFLLLLFRHPPTGFTDPVLATAALLVCLGIALIAASRDSGITGTGPTVAAGIIVLIAIPIARGIPEWLPDPAMTLFTLSFGPHEPAISLGSVAATLALLIAACFQLLRPSTTRGALFAAIACLTPLGFGVAADGELLAYAGGAILLLWTGLLAHAWSLAFIDELTGLPNRRALELRLGKNGQAVAMADVDHFKEFNDTWGHDAGDQVLRRVAENLAMVHGGRAYRYGGEEFVLVFRSRSPARIAKALEDCRRTIAARPFYLRGQRVGTRDRGRGGGRAVRITVSFGLAMPLRGDSGSDTLKRADVALYRAKRNGRNRVEVRE